MPIDWGGEFAVCGENSVSPAVIIVSMGVDHERLAVCEMRSHCLDHLASEGRSSERVDEHEIPLGHDGKCIHLFPCLGFICPKDGYALIPSAVRDLLHLRSFCVQLLREKVFAECLDCRML
jgi:hypothetical protein